MTSAALLAPDPVLPQRDTLLDGEAVARVLAQRLGPVRACEVVRAKYRVGESIRVRYRVEAAGRDHEVACRGFAPGRSERAYRGALERAVQTGRLQPVGWAPELETVFWTFPNDRKLALRDLPAELASNLVAYVPEKSATFRRDGDDGRPLTFLKVYAGDDVERAAAVHGGLRDAGVRVPRVLGWSLELRAVLVEALAGRPLADLAGGELAWAYALLGGALAHLHDLPPLDGERFRRLDPGRLTRVAALVATVRPDAAGAAEALAAELGRRRDDASSVPVCLHGDPHPRNVLLHDASVGLVDLDQVAGGPAAAELGSVLAGLRYARVAEGLPEARERRLAAAFLNGYAASRALPPAPALRWSTAAALLAERALRAVNRVRVAGLANLRPLLADARALLDG
jgi:Ser/Thr protein kinase RdoA (MazF antagonist)